MTEDEFFTAVEELLPTARSTRLSRSIVRRRLTDNKLSETSRLINFSFVKADYNTEQFSGYALESILQQVKNYAL